MGPGLDPGPIPVGATTPPFALSLARSELVEGRETP
jgi:hypothetical protein